MLYSGLSKASRLHLKDSRKPGEPKYPRSSSLELHAAGGARCNFGWQLLQQISAVLVGASTIIGGFVTEVARLWQVGF